MSGEQTSRLARSWEANAPGWTRAVRDGAIASRRLATDGAILAAVLEARPRRVLDLGCGEGWLTRALTGRGIEAVGVDASAPLVESARAAGGGVFHTCSYAELTRRPDRLGIGYDVVACNFALLDEELSPLLEALRSLLASEGRLLIQTVHPWTARGGGPYRDGWRTESFETFAGEFPEPMPWYFRTLESWIGSLCASGYSLVDLREPRHPETGDPLSLLLAAVARP